MLKYDVLGQGLQAFPLPVRRITNTPFKSYWRYQVLTQERLKELLHYNPLTGIFTWIVAPGFRRDLDGEIAGAGHKGCRVQIVIDYINHKAHRLAFLYMKGRWPYPEIDHKDGDPSNNAWDNLREVNRIVNQQNIRTALRNNKTGFLGVHSRRGRFCAKICANHKRYHIGDFDTPEEAHQAYIEKKRELHEGCLI